MDINKSLSSEMIELAKTFPTNEKELLAPNGYFGYLFHYLSGMSGKFLEIGYRKGFFLEVCKKIKIPSVHIDITDKLLRAVPTDNNTALVMDSIKFLKTTTDKFGLVFQDGSKEFKYRWEEYQLIHERGLLEGGYIISDDLHYSGCRKAFQQAQLELGYKALEIKVHGGKRKLGVLSTMEVKPAWK